MDELNEKDAKKAYEKEQERLANLAQEAEAHKRKLIEETAEIEAQVAKRTYTAEKQKLRDLVKEREKLLRKIKEQGIEELNIIRGTHRDKLKLAEEEARFREKQEARIRTVKASFEKEGARAIVQARASTGSIGAMAQDHASKQMDKMLDKTKNYAKSLFEVETVWAAVVALLTMAVMRISDIAKTQASLRRAGMEGAPGMFGYGGEMGSVKSSVLGGINSQIFMSDSSKMKYLQSLAGSPSMLRKAQGDNGQGLAKVAGGFGFFGFSLEDTFDVVEKAGNNLNSSFDKLADTIKTASVVAKSTNMNFKDAFTSVMRLSGQMRGLTFNSKAAEELFAAVSSSLNELKFSPQEMQQFAESFGSMLGHMSVSTLTGLTTLANGGRMPTSRDQLEAAANQSLPTIVSAFKPILDQFQKGSVDRLLATQKLAEQFGLGFATNFKGAQGLERIIDQYGTNPSAANNNLNALKSKYMPEDEFRRVVAEGFKTLQSTMIKDQIEDALKVVIEGFSSVLIPFVKGFGQQFGPTAWRVMQRLDSLGEHAGTFFSPPTSNSSNIKKGMTRIPPNEFLK